MMFVNIPVSNTELSGLFPWIAQSAYSNSSSEIGFCLCIPTINFFQYYPKFRRNIRSKALYANF